MHGSPLEMPLASQVIVRLFRSGDTSEVTLGQNPDQANARVEQTVTLLGNG